MENSCSTRLQRVLGAAVLVFFVCVAAPSARAANNCPWLNEATASGLLGGPSTGAFQPASDSSPAVCAFTQQNTGVTRILQIEVETTPEAVAHLKSLEKVCGSESSPLQAIGNEAVSCFFEERQGRMGVRAFGRVRDQVFTIRISSTQKNDPLLTRNQMQRLIATAAEQVSGNLF